MSGCETRMSFLNGYTLLHSFSYGIAADVEQDVAFYKKISAAFERIPPLHRSARAPFLA